MYDFKVGVIVDSFRIGVHEGVKKARDVGAAGIQMYATRGEMAPENLNTEARKELLKYVKDNGLVFSAICGDLGGHGFMEADANPARIEQSKRILQLALELECSVVTTHIGVVPADESHPRYKILRDACSELAVAGQEIGGTFAIETGPEPSHVLRRFLDSLGGNGMRVNFDPANLAMVIGEDIPTAVENLKDYIVHTHAKDGKMLVRGNPEIIYGCFTDDSVDGGGRDIKYFLETPLGQGDVPFKAYLDKLAAVGYKGFLTIEREVGGTPEADIRLAVDFLKNYIG